MGAPTMSVQKSIQDDNQNGFMPDFSKITFPGQGGQPTIGNPNIYSNTVGPWDNQQNQQTPMPQLGKGKGA